MIITADDVDSWAEYFSDLRPASRRSEREARAKQERRTQLTEKQRERSSAAVRTEQINFRCSGDFKSNVAGMQTHLHKKRGGRKPSIADVLEEALALLAKTEGYNA